MNNHFGTMPYNPNFACDPTPGTNESYQISPLDIQVCYKKLFDIYKGAFPNQEGEFITLLRLYNGDYRRAVITIETKLLEKEATEMNELFGAKLP